MPLPRLLIAFALALPFVTHAQATAPSASETYEKRLRQERINGKYIPSDLADAIATLERITSAESQEAYASRPEDVAVGQLWFSFGRWLATSWGFYDGSRFSDYLRRIGVDTPDGQKEFVMRAYHRHLNGEDLDVKQLAEDYKARRAAADSLRVANATVLRRLGPPVRDTTERP